ncbi:MAG: hypothetical protein JWR26_370 [Pedosphaera sp.]|nr:hypothetical protein [Pedosphaera sp.]
MNNPTLKQVNNLLPDNALSYRKVLVFKSRHWLLCLLLSGILIPDVSVAQIDPVERQLIQLGYNQPIEGRAPISAYAFYYYNQPNFLSTNLTLRLAVAPVYLDSELGISHALGENTDVGFGIAGGGFADSYYEVDKGKYFPDQSFTGNSANGSASIYHLFNPTQRIPLTGVLRGEVHYAPYVRDDETAPNFVLPKDMTSFDVRTGFRFGGKEPLISPDLAMEISGWYQGEFRLNSGPYGFNGDRRVEASSHLFWGRALLAYTLPEWKHNFLLSLTGGSSVNADRFSAYRLGGLLPLASEFPLTLPGYFYQELSSDRFGLLNGTYILPLDKRKRWSLTAVASTAYVHYLPGLEQPGHWNTGVGGGIGYRSTSDTWQILLDYSYGFNAIRSSGRGGQSIGLLVQFNLERTKAQYYDPGANNFMIRGLDRFLHSFD